MWQKNTFVFSLYYDERKLSQEDYCMPLPVVYFLYYHVIHSSHGWSQCPNLPPHDMGLLIDFSCLHQLVTSIPQYSDTPQPFSLSSCYCLFKYNVLPSVHSCCCFLCPLLLHINAPSFQIYQFHHCIQSFSLRRVICHHHKCPDSMGGFFIEGSKKNLPVNRGH